MNEITVGADNHADLWVGFAVLRRSVTSFAEVAMGEHKDYGLTVVTTDGIRSAWTWRTERPILVMSGEDETPSAESEANDWLRLVG